MCGHQFHLLWVNPKSMIAGLYGICHMMWSVFSYACLPYLFHLWGRCLLRSLTHFLIKWFVFLLLSFKNFLCIVDNSPLSYVYFSNIFSQSMSCLLILLTVPFKEQKCLMKSSLLIISLMDCAFGVLSKK